MSFLLMFLLVIVVSVVASVISWKKTQESKDRWGEIADHKGFQYERGNFLQQPEMSGNVDGLNVRVKIVVEGSGDTRKLLTRYRVQHPQRGPDLVLTKQAAFSFIGRMLGRTDVEIGDPLFDDRVVIDTDDQEAVREFLNPTRRAAVIKLFNQWPEGKITSTSVMVQTRGFQADAMVIDATIERIVAVARLSAEPDDLDQILQRQREGHLKEAVDALRALNELGDNSFTELLEAEALVELGEHEKAAAVLDRLDGRLPSDRAVDGWHEVAALPPPPAPAPLTEMVVEDGPDQQVVIDDLFDPQRMSWQVVERFETEWCNKVVDWQGMVDSAAPYTHDADFGPGPGVRAVVLLGTVGQSAYVSNQVHAVVALSSTFVPPPGSHLVFRGRLTHVDRFSRKLFISEASVLD